MDIELAKIKLDSVIIGLHNGAEKLIGSQSKIDHPVYSNTIKSLRYSIAKSLSETALELLEIKKLLDEKS